MKILKHLFTALLLMVATVAMAHDFEVGGIYYSILSEEKKTVEVTYRGDGYSSYSNEYNGSVDIPSSVISNGITYAVTSIGDDAFYSCSGLTSITIPNSVTSIGNYAFSRCTGLKELRIEDGYETLSLGCNYNEGLFYDRPLETLYLGRNLSYDTRYSPFYNIKTLKSVTIGNSVTSIGSSVFSGCTGLTSITIPNSVTSIGGSAFSGCTGLTSVKIPNSVTNIGEAAFRGCTGLTSVTIPNSVTSIGYSAFEGTAWYNNLPDGVVYAGKVLYTYKGTMLENTNISIKEGTLGIANSAFSGCSGLTSITIPNSLTSIGYSAFYGCSGLKEVHISDLTSWCNIDFNDYKRNPLYYAHNLYLNGELVTELVIPDGVCEIKDYAFSGCSGLTSVTIPNSVTSIGDSAFSGCSGLISVTISNSVTSIGDSAFDECTNLKELRIEDGGAILSLGYNSTYEGLFYDCPLETLYLGRDLSYYSYSGYGNSPFYNIKTLKSVTIGNSVTSIGSSVFSGCTGLTSITIPNSVTSIGGSAFSGCAGLTSVTIPNSVTSIGDYAFDGCSGLKKIDFNCKNIGSWFKYNTSIEEVIIGNGVTSIGSRAFSGCTGLTSVTISNSVTSIGGEAFDGCSGLTSITIPNSVTSIGKSAFKGCSGLTSITIPNSVTSIGSDAFLGCSNLNKAIWLTNTPPTGYENVGATINYVANDQYSGLSNVKVYPYLSSLFEVGGVKYVPVSPAERTCDAIDCVYDSTAVDINIEKTVLFKGIAMNVKQVMPYTFYANKNIKTIKVENDGIVGNYAFSDCTALNSATISNNGYIGERAFCGCSSLVTATLGDSIASIGASAFNGCSKLSEIVIPDAVTAIGSEAFENCKSLETVKVGNGTKSIDSYAFGGCSALSSITLGDSVTTIGGDAFYACSSLPEIVIPQSVTKINSFAFDGCTALADVIIEDRTTALSLGSNGSSLLFRDCPLDSVYIGGKITYSTSSSYGYSPFYRNTSLRSVVITDTEEEVYDNEFYGCSNLKNVSIGNGVKKIGNWAFSGCSALDYFAFGNSVQSIGEEAFSDCNNVTKLISSASTPPVCGTQALDDINKWNCTLYVPNESKSAYQSAEQWKEFFFVEDLPTAIVSVLPDYKIQEPVYYDLQGRKVDNPTNGIYIINGKKVFVK